MIRIIYALSILVLFVSGVQALSTDVLIENESYREVVGNVIQVNFAQLMTRLKLTDRQKTRIGRLVEKAETSREKFLSVLKKEKRKIIAEFTKLRDNLLKKSKLTDSDKNAFNKKMDSIGLAMEDCRVEINELVKDLWDMLTEDQKKIILGYNIDLLAFLEENPVIWDGKTKLNDEDQRLMDKVETIFFRTEIKELLKNK